MTTTADFTADEWKAIQRAPFMAGLVVVAASSSGPLGVVKEMFAVGGMLADAKLHGASSDLVKALVADLETADARQENTPADLQDKTPDEMRAAALEACRQVAAVVDGRAGPDETRAFKAWLVSVGRKTAEAAKEGGFLGFGGTLVSQKEAGALKDLTSALGVEV